MCAHARVCAQIELRVLTNRAGKLEGCIAGGCVGGCRRAAGGGASGRMAVRGSALRAPSACCVRFMAGCTGVCHAPWRTLDMIMTCRADGRKNTRAGRGRSQAGSAALQHPCVLHACVNPTAPTWQRMSIQQPTDREPPKPSSVGTENASTIAQLRKGAAQPILNTPSGPRLSVASAPDSSRDHRFS